MKLSEKYSNLLNAKFGRLTIIEVIETHGPTNRITYSLKCLCECRNISTPTLHKLTNGSTVSCGCLRKEKMRKAFFALKRELEMSFNK